MERLIRIHTLSLSLYLEIFVLLVSCLSIDNEFIEIIMGIVKCLSYSLGT